MITNIKISNSFVQNCLNKEIYLLSQLLNSDELLLSNSEFISAPRLHTIVRFKHLLY